jgi:putative tryptophan/tyrosine transport system substrate-binding protein
MRRRELIRLVSAGAVYLPLRPLAQEIRKVYRVGFIFTSARLSDMDGQNPSNPALRMFVHTLRDLGYVEGSNLVLELRSAEGRYERFPEIVRELVSLKVDVIITITNAMTQAAKEVTRTIPIVMGVTRDPVADGLVQSLGRPGASITGLTSDAGLEIVGKRIQLLKEIVPTISRLILLHSKGERLSEGEQEQIFVSAERLGVKLRIAESTTDYADAFAFIEREKPDGLLVGDSAGNYFNRSKIVEFAAWNRIPAMYGSREYIEAGGLAAYGVDIIDLFRRAAGYVDKILRGADPAELPVEQPTKFHLIVNLRTASLLGLTVPPSVIALAHEVIE